MCVKWPHKSRFIKLTLVVVNLAISTGFLSTYEIGPIQLITLLRGKYASGRLTGVGVLSAPFHALLYSLFHHPIPV